jgi:hypothetical protein
MRIKKGSNAIPKILNPVMNELVAFSFLSIYIC